MLRLLLTTVLLRLVAGQVTINPPSLVCPGQEATWTWTNTTPLVEAYYDFHPPMPYGGPPGGRVDIGPRNFAQLHGSLTLMIHDFVGTLWLFLITGTFDFETNEIHGPNVAYPVSVELSPISLCKVANEAGTSDVVPTPDTTPTPTRDLPPSLSPSNPGAAVSEPQPGDQTSSPTSAPVTSGSPEGSAVSGGRTLLTGSTSSQTGSTGGTVSGTASDQSLTNIPTGTAHSLNDNGTAHSLNDNGTAHSLNDNPSTSSPDQSDAYLTVRVSKPNPSDKPAHGSLSPSAVAGICVGVIPVVITIIFAMWRNLHRKKVASSSEEAKFVIEDDEAFPPSSASANTPESHSLLRESTPPSSDPTRGYTDQEVSPLGSNSPVNHTGTGGQPQPPGDVVNAVSQVPETESEILLPPLYDPHWLEDEEGSTQASQAETEGTESRLVLQS